MDSSGPCSDLSENQIPNEPVKEKTLSLALLALGIVFGDIGTSPLYALRECFSGNHSLIPTAQNVLGVVSLLFRTLVVIVSVKYVLFVLRADNRGEGGILALMTLVNQKKKDLKRYSFLIVSMGILGAALLYGDGIITPAISVLSAIEGLTVATSFFKPFVMPFSIFILVILFLIQSKGTAKVGSLFGPVMIFWFIVIGLLGIFSIIRNPQILIALNPIFAIKFLIQHGTGSFVTLGSVFLAVTGAEVLYADLGHFGVKPVRMAWFYLVFPCLVLNYFGQGAYLLSSPQSVDNLFYRIAPSFLLYPLVALATTATVIASQAVISGAFSLAKQSVQLGFWPRIQIRHTSTQAIGQVYVPFINWALLLGTVVLILLFKESSHLASAYGIAVSGTMLITTILIILVARRLWRIRLSLLIPFSLLFLLVDCSFFFSNVTKIWTGGWVVLVIAISIYVLMKTWIGGREILRTSLIERSINLDVLMDQIRNSQLTRVSGIAVFLSANPDAVPGALLHNLKHNKVLHENTLLLSINTQDIPYVSESKRVEISSLGNGIYRVILNFGFSETPDIPYALQNVQFSDFKFKIMLTTFFLGREALIVGNHTSMPIWKKKIFWFMSNNALNATHFYKLPQNSVVELGSRIEI
jgi:KUP system potassium uptake protein